MSWVRIWVHLVFATRNRVPHLNTPDLRQQVFEHIMENARGKGIWLDCVNGWQEHVHCILSLGREQTISKTAQLIKGESSFWINKNKLTVSKFNWQDDYWAVSVSESHVPALRDYLREQETHHRKRTFQEEVEVFMKIHGLREING